MNIDSRKILYHLIFLVFTLTFFLFFITCMPTSGTNDNPEFIDASQTLGVAHPAGFPTFSMMNKCLLLIPFGSIPFRTTVLSGFYGALSSVVIFLCIFLISKHFSSSIENNYHSIIAIFISVLFYSTSNPLWSTSVEAEVYTLNALFLSLTWLFGLRWAESQNDYDLCIGGLIYGLAAGNHASVGLYAPGFLLFILFTSNRNTFRRLLLLVFFFSIGFSIYLYLPIRASVNPPMNFGNPHSVTRFITHVLDQKDSYVHFSGAQDNFKIFKFFWVLIATKVPTYFWLGIFPFILVGLIFIWKTSKPLLSALLFIAIFNYFFFYYWVASFAIFLPAFICLTIFFGTGLSYVFTKFREVKSLKYYFYLLPFIIVLIFTITLNIIYKFSQFNQSNAHVYFEGFADELIDFPPDSIVMVVDHWFNFLSLQDVKRIRNDISVITISDLASPEYFNPLTNSRFQDVNMVVEDSRIESNIHRVAYFIYENVKDKHRPLYMAYGPYIKSFYPNLVPGPYFFYKVTDEPLKQLPEKLVKDNITRILNKIERDFSAGDLYFSALERYYVQYITYHTIYLNKYGFHDDALFLLTNASHTFWKNNRRISNSFYDAFFSNAFCETHLYLSNFSEAKKYSLKAVRRASKELNFWINLGRSLAGEKDYDKALSVLQYVLQENPLNAHAHFEIATVYENVGSRSYASKHYRDCINISGNSEFKKKAKERLISFGLSGL